MTFTLEGQLETSQVRSAEGVPAARGLDPVPAAHGSVLTEDVLVAVQLGLGQHQAGVVLRAAMFDA